MCIRDRASPVQWRLRNILTAIRTPTYAKSAHSIRHASGFAAYMKKPGNLPWAALTVSKFAALAYGTQTFYIMSKYFALPQEKTNSFP